MKIKPLDTIERIFVTCSMTPPPADIGVKELAGSHRRQGYSSVAVHFVIRQDGSIEKGRDTRLRGAVSPAFSSDSLQVCLVGGLNDALETKGIFTPMQMGALLRLKDAHGVPLAFGHEAPLQTLKETMKDY